MNANLAEGTIRLVGGSNSHEGRVEIYVLGRWCTVCDYRFSIFDALVVCRQLGYSIDTDWRNGTFGRGSGFVWLWRVECTGYETNLLQCRSEGLGIVSSDCHDHNDDAHVICSGEYSLCIDRYTAIKYVDNNVTFPGIYRGRGGEELSMT